MYPRTNYEMTQADLDAILDACKPTPVMFLSGGRSMFGTPQENANRAWSALGKKMGFDHMTVQPVQGKGTRFFTAVPNETESQKTARLETEKRTARDKRIAELRAQSDSALSEMRELMKEQRQDEGSKAA